MNMYNEIIEKIKNHKLNQQGNTIFINNFSLYVLLNEKIDIDQIDNIHIDGIALLRFVNFFYKKKFKRYSFDETSLAKLYFEKAKKNQSYVFVGTKENYLKKSIHYIKKKYENINISYYRNGYFNDEKDYIKCINEIVKITPDYVIVGMGTPKQEQFLIDLRKNGWHGKGFTCGGFFHQSSKMKEYYPKFYDKLNIRWVYRVIDEPKLMKRYFIIYPYSFIKFIYYYLRSKINI